MEYPRAMRQPGKPISRNAKLAIAMVVLAACAATPVILTPEGERVTVLEPPFDLQGCKNMGRIQASASNFRGDVEEQRLINARNKAVLRGGNRIVTGSVQLLGARDFDVYACPDTAPPKQP
jgi:hypothetical protein